MVCGIETLLLYVCPAPGITGPGWLKPLSATVIQLQGGQNAVSTVLSLHSPYRSPLSAFQWAAQVVVKH